MLTFSHILAILLLIPSGLAGGSSKIYQRTDKIVGSDFYKKFDFQAIPDPTHGHVTYVDKATARKDGLTQAVGKSFKLRADYKTVLQPNGPGRKSVRIRSKKAYRTHVAVFDIKHIPVTCASWPAVWETKEDGWPRTGEIDIVEGVNGKGDNGFTLHTSPNCTMPAVRQQTGIARGLNCDAKVNSNAGCSVTVHEPNNYGPSFNANGGGWYAIERTETFIQGWFWPRNSKTVPQEVAKGAKTLSTANWGKPAAIFPDTTCDLKTHFSENHIIINLTLCGDWAGAVYSQSGCPSTCVDFVNKNPAAFKDAYFEFRSIRVYE